MNQAVTTGATAHAAASGRRRDPLYWIVSLAFAALVVFAFAHRYYFAAWSDAPALPARLQVHGAVMSGWVMLLLLQSGLIRVRRVSWHRGLGLFGAAWAAMVVFVGSATTLQASARAVRSHSRMATLQLTVTGLELAQMLMFALLVGLAVVLRRRREVHKRLMLLTAACMLPSPLSRMPVDWFPSNVSILLAVDGAILLVVGLDSWRHRRLHPAFAWGGGGVAAGLHLAFLGAYAPAWRIWLRAVVS